MLQYHGFHLVSLFLPMGFRGYPPIVPAASSVLLLVLSGAAAWPNPQAPGTTTPAQLDRAARLMNAGDWAKAEQTLRAVLHAHPKQPEALNMLGITAGKQGRVEEAESLFHKALGSDPSLAAAWVNLAQIYKERG